MRKIGFLNRFTSVFFISCVCFLSVLILSSSWINKHDAIPLFVKILSIILFIGTVLLIVAILLNVFSLLKMRSPSKLKAYKEFIDNAPDMKNHIDELESKIRRNELRSDSNEFKSYLEEIKWDFKALIKVHLAKRRLKLLKIVSITLAALILTFASIYINDYTIERFLFNQKGFCNMSIPDGGIIDWALEGFYYSVVTITTLGFGDIHPSTTLLPRIFAIIEVLSFVFIISIGFNFLAQNLENRLAFDHEDFTYLLRRNLQAIEISIQVPR